jgi:hypothetical protein
LGIPLGYHLVLTYTVLMPSYSSNRPNAQGINEIDRLIPSAIPPYQATALANIEHIYPYIGSTSWHFWKTWCPKLASCFSQQPQRSAVVHVISARIFDHLHKDHLCCYHSNEIHRCWYQVLSLTDNSALLHFVLMSNVELRIDNASNATKDIPKCRSTL